MPRPEGTPKTGGRKRGTPNRRTLDLAEQLNAVGLDVTEELVKTLPDLDAKSRATVLLELMNFLFPKRKAVEHTGAAPVTLELTKEELQARVKEDSRQLDEMQTPEEKRERQERVAKLLDIHMKLKGR